jgi:nicotinamide phosphoribosyltransferase
MSYNISAILNTDSYKASQFVQMPDGTEYVYSYIESRGGAWDQTVFFGLQSFLREYLSKPITQADIDEAELIITAHGEPFNRAGWQYIVDNHNGYLPLEVRAVDEGTILPVSNVLVTVVNTDPKCFWLTSYIETALLRAVWYGTTVATNSFESKKIIAEYLMETSGSTAGLDFKLHDFGARGCSSEESAALGGAAHLVNFMGTDTISALLAAKRYYDADMAGFSIPAMEHSTVTSWGRENEVASYRNMLNNFAKPGAILAAVSDSYDIYNACKLWGTELKDQVVSSGATLVVRPDSGEPATVVVKCLCILDQYFGHTVNAKGYRVLNNVRVIQGDGIDHSSIRSILYSMELAGYSAENVAFGQGGALLQQVNRDTLKFAMKASAAKVNGVWRDVYKDPITDKGKRSKKGLLGLMKVPVFDAAFNQIGENYHTVSQEYAGEQDLLKLRFRNGDLFNQTTFAEVRERANKPFNI